MNDAVYRRRHRRVLGCTAEPSQDHAVTGPNHTRRSFIAGSAAVATTAALGPVGCAFIGGGRFRDDPFTLGVASGDPSPDGVVLWTRLAPDPLSEAGGMSAAPVPVRWELAEDERFARLVRTGEAMARAETAHAVHVEVTKLAPARTYHYRFIAGDAVSAVGRTRTAPAPGSSVAAVRLASLGCQNYEDGFYTAYARVAEDDLDLVLHTGDYIYEGGARRHRRLVRAHPPEECRTLAHYRQRYALYKSDPDLRAAHAAHPFAPVFDDHELSNDWARDRNGHGEDGVAFATRRAAAFRAWYEHMPVRRPQRPVEGWIRIFRTLDYGGLVRLALLDTRQYRTPQPCGGRNAPRCGEDAAPQATMLGDHQERWLQGELARSPARWNAIVQQVMMAELDRDTDPEARRYAMDKWDGYLVPRRRLLRYLADARIVNPVVLTGDLHRHVAAVLRPDFARPDTPAVATEFVTASISSNGDGHATDPIDSAWPAQNPHVAFAANQRGYCRHTVTENGWSTEFRVLDRVTVPGARARTRARYTVEPGRAALHLA